MRILDNYKEVDKYKDVSDMTLEERVEFLEGCVAQLMIKTAEMSNTLNVLVRASGALEDDPEGLANLEAEIKHNSELIEDFEISKFKKDIEDL